MVGQTILRLEKEVGRVDTRSGDFRTERRVSAVSARLLLHRRLCVCLRESERRKL